MNEVSKASKSASETGRALAAALARELVPFRFVFIPRAMPDLAAPDLRVV
jgi:hypothetical protein